jgi:hypothetical protein
VIVSSLLAGIYEGIREHIPAYIFTLGVLMEHGMLVSETLVHQLEKLRATVTSEVQAAQAGQAARVAQVAQLAQVAQPVGGSPAQIG